MKTWLLTLLTAFFLQAGIAGQLGLVQYNNLSTLKTLHQDKNLTVHFSGESFVIATVSPDFKGEYILLDNKAFENEAKYYIAWFRNGFESGYATRMGKNGVILKATDSYLILKTTEDSAVGPPTNGSVVAINNTVSYLPQQTFLYTTEYLSKDQNIVEMMNAVDTVLFLSNLQHLQDYGTRNAYSPEAVMAQNWIKEQFESYGYTVDLFDFWMPGGAASDNVIATKTGTKYPDEYVVLGAHYDSYSFSGAAPGADDNGSGTCGVMEVARVMSQYEFDRTILFCAWSGEEYGLYGSAAYAEWAKNEGLNILGYFNIDMCGYRHPGHAIHTDIIAPASAQPLVQFYKDVCDVYLPDFGVFDGSLSGGDSDHTSFNNNGYMGIFPFEDSQHYSPHIHSPNDLIGPSVNSLEMAMNFTQAMVANVATLANWLAPPANLMAFPGDEIVELTWDALNGIDQYNVYKNNDPTPYTNTTNPFFTDTSVENFVTYAYYVTAIYTGTGDESSPSNLVEATPLPPMAFPFFDDFESGALYWAFEGSWGLSTAFYHSPGHSITESPSGNYANNQEISTTLYPFSLENATEASFSFYTRYALEQDYDYTYLEISTDGINWTTLETFNGFQNSWNQKTYSLSNYLGQPYVSIRFRFKSDTYVTEDGMYIDDFEILVEGSNVGVTECPAVQTFYAHPNPASQKVNFSFGSATTGEYTIIVYNMQGKAVKSFSGRMDAENGVLHADVSDLPEGTYLSRIVTAQKTETIKTCIIR